MIIQSHLYDRVYVFTPQMVAYHCLEMLIEVSQHGLSHHVKLECLLCLRRTWDNTAALLHWELQGIPSPLSLCLSDKEIILHNYRTKQQDYLHSGNKGLLHWNSWTDVVVETPACEQGPHYTKRQTVPSDNELSFGPVQFNTDWIKQNIALSFSLKLHSSKYCGGWKKEMRGAAKANKQIERIICCERLNCTGWPIGLDCWNQSTSSTSTTYKKK